MVNEVKNLDCIIALKEFPDNYFDLAIVDLEYGIGASKPSDKPTVIAQKNGSKLNIKKSNYTKKEWDFKLSSSEYFTELFRVSKEQIIFGGNYYGLEGGYLVWDKLNGENDQFGCELAWLSFTKRTDIVYYMWSGMMQGMYCGKDISKAVLQQGNKTLNEKRIHPTQKPVLIYKYLLSNYAKYGYKILDTHLGSGSSRIAAYDMGFDFYGYELDSEYFNLQEERFNKHIRQQSLFEPSEMYQLKI